VNAFGIYVLTVGLVMGALTLLSLLRGLDSPRWPAASGVVADSRYERGTDGEYYVAVEFTYDVQGRSHTRTQTLQTWPPTERRASRVLARYPEGSDVEVRYKPSKPSVAVVRPGVAWTTWMWAVVSSGVLVLGAALLAGWV
jgi:Protein of unknown function (DUF3592)